MDIIIIGGGASGILAALKASENKENNITILEKQSRIGRKILSTGNGRCNLTNVNVSLDNYHGENPSFVLPALDAFPPQSVIDYFLSLGLLSQIQYGGRVYPLSDSANSVLDVLRFACISKGINIDTDCPVKGASFKKGKFYVFTDVKVYSSDRLVVACGGPAGGKLGASQDGISILKSFGHHSTKLFPALVPITIDSEYPKSLKGVRVNAELSLNGTKSSGELQFTDNGISGPVAFDISREASIHGGTVQIDFLTGNIIEILRKRKVDLPELEAGNLLTGILHNRLSMVIVKYCGIRPSQPIKELTEQDLINISNACRCFKLKVKGVSGFDNAQITAGGIRTGEFNPSTMESVLVPGLYACGEVLDIDADCGGYNLQWAWSSGYLAGKSL